MNLFNDCNILKPENIDYLNDRLINKNGYIKILPAKEYHKINYDHLRLFAHINGIYSYPTLELANWLKDHFDMSNCIEIGAGHGSLAYHLNIPATDSRLTDKPEIKLLYNMTRQPPTRYGDNIEELEALQAIKKYKPDTVIAQWVTHIYNPKEDFRGGNMYGVDEQFIIENVKNYIFIGNSKVHKLKPILHIPHRELKPDWIISRASEPDKNIIYFWTI